MVRNETSYTRLNCEELKDASQVERSEVDVNTMNRRMGTQSVTPAPKAANLPDSKCDTSNPVRQTYLELILRY